MWNVLMHGVHARRQRCGMMAEGMKSSNLSLVPLAFSAESISCGWFSAGNVLPCGYQLHPSTWCGSLFASVLRMCNSHWCVSISTVESCANRERSNTLPE
jgi:hypothetical protein